MICIPPITVHPPLTQPMFVAVSEEEADDELEAEHGSRRVKPAARRAYIRGLLSKRNERGGKEPQQPRATGKAWLGEKGEGGVAKERMDKGVFFSPF